MDKKFKAKIIQALRKLSWSWGARKSAMKKQQRGSQERPQADQLQQRPCGAG